MNTTITQFLAQYWIFIALALAGIGGYWLYYYLHRYYYRGLKQAKEIVTAPQFSPPEKVDNVHESTSIIERLQDQVFGSLDDQKKLSDKEQDLKGRIANLQKKIQDLKGKKQHLMDKEINVQVDDSHFEQEEAERQDKLRNLDRKIQTREEQLEKAKQRRLNREDAEQQPKIKDPLKDYLEFVSDFVNDLAKKTMQNWILFIAVVVDYAIATSFFWDVAMDRNLLLLRIAEGLALPLILTAGAFYFLHLWLHKRNRFFSGLMAGTVIFGVLGYRLLGLFNRELSPGSIGSVVFFWIGFVVVVFFLAFQTQDIGKDLQKEGLDHRSEGSELFTTVLAPALLPLAIVTSWVLGIANFLGRVWLSITSSTPGESNKEKEISAELEKARSEKSRVQGQLEQTQKERERFRARKIKQTRKEQKEEKKNELQGINQRITDKQNQKKALKNTLNKIQNWLSDLRRGSDDGVMAGLREREEESATQTTKVA